MTMSVEQYNVVGQSLRESRKISELGKVLLDSLQVLLDDLLVLFEALLNPLLFSKFTKLIDVGNLHLAITNVKAVGASLGPSLPTLIVPAVAITRSTDEPKEPENENERRQPDPDRSGTDQNRVPLSGVHLTHSFLVCDRSIASDA